MENRVSRGHGQYSASADKRATEHRHNISEFGFFPPAEAASGVERTPPPGDGSDTVTRRCVSLAQYQTVCSGLARRGHRRCKRSADTRFGYIYITDCWKNGPMTREKENVARSTSEADDKDNTFIAADDTSSVPYLVAGDRRRRFATEAAVIRSRAASAASEHMTRPARTGVAQLPAAITDLDSTYHTAGSSTRRTPEVAKEGVRRGALRDARLAKIEHPPTPVRGKGYTVAKANVTL
ncbi:hypothetical protein GEV33_008643 [Tenebrio molitor]|uniref:Uncharacterized protein n=1 Tax=Tenebrio molitor TaxID=7067 RepID=A0A8J6LC44_TENMO|nr:hypothetical protein GEV33_008643 [Tenebrio molitor]